VVGTDGDAQLHEFLPMLPAFPTTSEARPF